MAKLSLTDVANISGAESTAISTINTNHDLIEAALENTLSRNGTTPNTMEADLDMNSNQILNLPVPATSTEPLRLGDIGGVLSVSQIYFQASEPTASSAPPGSLWFDSDSADIDIYQLSSGAWVDTGVNAEGQNGTDGADGAQGPTGPQGPQGDTGPAGATGATGATGPTGATGAQGPAGQGVPAGGTTGQVAQKASNADYDVTWADAASGSGDLVSTNNLSDVTSALTSRENLYASPFDAMAYNGLQVNGFQQISQENGSTAVVPGNRPVDEELFSSSNGTMTAQRVATPFTSRSDIPYGIELSVATGAALGVGDSIQVTQNIEGTRVNGKLAWGTSAANKLSIGRVVRSNVTGRGYVSIRNVLVNRSLVYHFDLTADTDTYVAITIDGDTTGGWSTDTTAGLVISWCFGAGSNLTTGTLNTWQAANHLAGNDVTNFFATTGNKVWLGPMVILPGDQLPSFADIMKCQRHPDDELRICQRYYVKESISGGFTNNSIASVNGFQVGFPVDMRAAPAITHISGAMTNHHISPPNSTENIFTTGYTALWTSTLYRNFTGTGYFEYSANARM